MQETGLICFYQVSITQDSSFQQKYQANFFGLPFLCMCGFIESECSFLGIVNTPGVAEAVLQTPLSLIKSASQSVSQRFVLCGNIFKTPSIPKRKGYRAETLRAG